MVGQFARRRLTCRVQFEQTGLVAPAAEALWTLSVWEEPLKTTPSNMLFCYGGFLKIPDADYDALLACIAPDTIVSTD